MDKDTLSKLYYLLDFLDDCIEKYTYDVLCDSESDPEFSAVTANNLIHCYNAVSSVLDRVSCGSTPEYLCERCFSPDEIQLFLKKKESESAYYIGHQYE